jgi:hypothetical protein
MALISTTTGRYSHPFLFGETHLYFCRDVGAFGGNLSPFYHQYPDSNLSTIAVGIGDGADDALLKIMVEGDEVKFELIPLAGGHFDDLTVYTPAYLAVATALGMNIQ